MTTGIDLTARADNRADAMLGALKALVECESPSHDLPAVNR
jgi:hypothetical protein